MGLAKGARSSSCPHPSPALSEEALQRCADGWVGGWGHSTPPGRPSYPSSTPLPRAPLLSLCQVYERTVYSSINHWLTNQLRFMPGGGDACATSSYDGTVKVGGWWQGWAGLGGVQGRAAAAKRMLIGCGGWPIQKHVVSAPPILPAPRPPTTALSPPPTRAPPPRQVFDIETGMHSTVHNANPRGWQHVVEEDAAGGWARQHGWPSGRQLACRAELGCAWSPTP